MKPLIKINHSVYWRCYTTNKSVNKKILVQKRLNLTITIIRLIIKCCVANK